MYDDDAVFPAALITQLSQETNIDDNEITSPDSNLPSHAMYAQTKMKKKKKPSSTKKYNSIRAEGELLANIASADSLEQFNKLLTLLRYVRANLQNKTGKELKEAASTYLDITEFDHNIDILPSSRMRTDGRMSTKRKVSSVESATLGAVKKCGFCKSIGHNKQSCPTALSIGKRMTKGIYDLICSVPNTVDSIGYENIDSVIPGDAMALQISEKCTIGENVYYKARILLIGLRFKDGNPYWISRSTLDEWCRQAASSSHYVFLKN